MTMGEQPKENPLHISWHDSVWIPHLNASNIMDYFAERTNPFYSRDCNNEFIKMQQNTRVDQLTHMQGVEYMLLHTQEPILYIIRKERRYSPTQVEPLANYHIIGGQVYQTPDLGSIINSRILGAASNLNSAFNELQSFSHYHPSRGYWWQFRNHSEHLEQQKKEKEKKEQQVKKEEPASVFQQRRVDSLLEDLQTRFPYKYPAPPQPAQPAQGDGAKPAGGEESKSDVKVEVKVEVKTEVKTESSSQAASQRSAKPPPEKRPRVGP